MKLQNDFIGALLKEISIRSEYLGGEEVKSIYFGGGTPSLLSEQDIEKIMNCLYGYFAIVDGAEITFEANPDDISSARLLAWKQQRINRLSIGIQSFYEEDLRWMNRAHNSDQATNSVKEALYAGFENMSIDLIYGGPTLTDEKWMSNLRTAHEFRVPHLSCYALTVESGTALDVLTRRKKVQNIESEDQARQFLLMTDFLEENGYEHYEISNFALPGKRSRHNSSYWSGEKYLGLGPSAHSFNGVSRQWNVSNNALYISSLKNNDVPREIETLTGVQRLNEYVMTSLRTMEGLDLEIVRNDFDELFAAKIEKAAQRFQNRGWLTHSGETLKLTREGKLFADGIAADLFAEDIQTSTDSMFLKPSRG